MALIYQPSKRIFCGWFEPLKSTTYSEYPWTVRLPPSVEELPRLKDEKLGRQLDACIKLDTASDAGVLHLGELLDRNAEEQDGNGKRYIDVPFGEFTSDGKGGMDYSFRLLILKNQIERTGGKKNCS